MTKNAPVRHRAEDFSASPDWTIITFPDRKHALYGVESRCVCVCGGINRRSSPDSISESSNTSGIAPYHIVKCTDVVRCRVKSLLWFDKVIGAVVWAFPASETAATSLMHCCTKEHDNVLVLFEFDRTYSGLLHLENI